MDGEAVWFLTLTLLSVGITVACILVGHRLRKLGLTLLIAISVWIAVWLIGYGVANSEWGTEHLSGWADCWPGCGAWDGVARWLVFGPLVVVVVAVIGVAVVAAIDRLESKGRT